MTYKFEQVVLSGKSVCLAINNFILLFSYSFHVPSTILFNVYLYILRSMFLFLFNRSQSMPSVVNQISQLFFWKLKNIFCSFELFENGHIHNVVSTLTNVVKRDVENNKIVSTLPNVVNIKVEIENVDSTLFNVVNFNVDIKNVVSTLIWRCPTSRRHIILTTTLSQLWNICWVLKNVAKRLHNFVRFIKLKTYIFNRIPLNCCVRKF